MLGGWLLTVLSGHVVHDFGVHIVSPYLLVHLFSLPLPKVPSRRLRVSSEMTPHATSHLALGIGLRGHLLYRSPIIKTYVWSQHHPVSDSKIVLSFMF